MYHGADASRHTESAHDAPAIVRRKRLTGAGKSRALIIEGELRELLGWFDGAAMLELRVEGRALVVVAVDAEQERARDVLAGDP